MVISLQSEGSKNLSLVVFCDLIKFMIPRILAWRKIILFAKIPVSKSAILSPNFLVSLGDLTTGTEKVVNFSSYKADICCCHSPYESLLLYYLFHVPVQLGWDLPFLSSSSILQRFPGCLAILLSMSFDYCPWSCFLSSFLGKKSWSFCNLLYFLSLSTGYLLRLQPVALLCSSFSFLNCLFSL